MRRSRRPGPSSETFTAQRRSAGSETFTAQRRSAGSETRPTQLRNVVGCGLLLALAGCAHRAPLDEPSEPPEGPTELPKHSKGKGPMEIIPARPLHRHKPMQTVILADSSKPIVSLRMVFTSGSIAATTAQ